MSDDDVEEEIGPAFQPGWPEILPLSLIIARTQVSQRRPPDGDDFELDDDVAWALHCSARSDTPRFAFIGDLIVSNPVGFGGVTVLMPFSLRNEPIEIDSQTRDEILQQYGPWAAGVMYDHAAMALRAALAGNGIPLHVPWGTPDVELHTSDTEDEDSDSSQ